jgi:hypothetical protein
LLRGELEASLSQGRPGVKEKGGELFAYCQEFYDRRKNSGQEKGAAIFSQI